MIQSVYNEPHFFDFWECDKCYRDLSSLSQTDIDEIRSLYKTEYFNMTELNQNPNLVTFEKTPMYMFHPKVPERIKTIVPWAKIIIVLRDPVERAYSTFRMNSIRFKEENVEHGEVTFETCVNIDIENLEKVGILNNENFWEITDEEKTLRWLQYFKTWNKGILTENEVCNGEIGRGLYYMQLLIWVKHYSFDEAKKEILIIKSETLKPDKATNKVNLKNITDFLLVDGLEVNVGERKIHSYEELFVPMNNETREELKKLFDPFNKQLLFLLGKEWDNPWPYD